MMMMMTANCSGDRGDDSGAELCSNGSVCAAAAWCIDRQAGAAAGSSDGVAACGSGYEAATDGPVALQLSEVAQQGSGPGENPGGSPDSMTA